MGCPVCGASCTADRVHAGVDQFRANVAGQERNRVQPELDAIDMALRDARRACERGDATSAQAFVDVAMVVLGLVRGQQW